MKSRMAWLGGAVLLCVSGVAWGADLADLRDDYVRKLARFERSGSGSLERVFEAARAASRALMEAARKDGGTEGHAWHIQGIHAGGQPLLVGPDPRYFLDLAKRRGTEVDREFFTLLNDTYYRDGVTRTYVVPHADPAVCHVFDHPEVESLYRNWTRFWATHPRAYTAAVDGEVKALEDMVAVSTCACGDRASVETGLERFLKSFPRAPVAPKVRARLEQVRAGTSDFRFRCPTG